MVLCAGIVKGSDPVPKMAPPGGSLGDGVAKDLDRQAVEVRARDIPLQEIKRIALEIGKRQDAKSVRIGQQAGRGRVDSIAGANHKAMNGKCHAHY